LKTLFGAGVSSRKDEQRATEIGACVGGEPSAETKSIVLLSTGLPSYVTSPQTRIV
jgi:hypothetical protein